MSKINSNRKGKVGELELVNLFKSYGFENAMRSQQIERDELGRFVGVECMYRFEGDKCLCFKGDELFYENYLFVIDSDDYEKVADKTWYEGQNGYIYQSGSHVTLHRVIMDAKDGDLIDHINRDKKDNRKSNLRFSNKSLNAFNSKLGSDNTSGHKGVYFRKDTKKWVANIRVNYKKIYLGCFKDIEGAVKARKEAEEKYIDWSDVSE